MYVSQVGFSTETCKHMLITDNSVIQGQHKLLARSVAYRIYQVHSGSEYNTAKRGRSGGSAQFEVKVCNKFLYNFMQQPCPSAAAGPRRGRLSISPPLCCLLSRVSWPSGSPLTRAHLGEHTGCGEWLPAGGQFTQDTVYSIDCLR